MSPSIPITEVAETLSISLDTVRALLDRGELRGHRVGRAVRIYVESVSDYQRRHEIEPKASPAPRRRPGRNRGHDEAMETLRRLGIN